VLGGIITSGIGWKWIFFVNIPIGAVAVFVTVTQVADSRDPDANGVDWAGLITFSGSLFLLIYALVQGNEKGWGSTEILALLIGAALLLIAFLAAESMQSRPMLDLSLFRRPAFVGANIVALTLSGSFFAMFLYLTLYIQDVLATAPSKPGCASCHHAAVLHRRPHRRQAQRARTRAATARRGTAVRGLRARCHDHAHRHLTLDRAHPRLPARRCRRRPRQPAARLHRHRRRTARAQRHGSGINSTFRQVGIATGIAGLGAIFQHSVTKGTTSALNSAGQLAPVQSAAHGHLAVLLESGEVTQIATRSPTPASWRSCTPTARASPAPSPPSPSSPP